jgi:hypothetical protein
VRDRRDRQAQQCHPEPVEGCATVGIVRGTGGRPTGRERHEIGGPFDKLRVTPDTLAVTPDTLAVTPGTLAVTPGTLRVTSRHDMTAADRKWRP